MRNDLKISLSGVRPKRGWSCLALLTLGGFPSLSCALNNLEVVLDGYAYAVNSDVTISLNQQFIFIAQSDLINCLRPDDLIPLNNADLTLITNNQGIGLEQFRYAVESRLLFLTSETNDLACDNGLFVDSIFSHGFEPVDLIFSGDFD